MSASKVLVPLAPGFEETEAIAIVDVLRRAELEVVTASLGELRVLGAHGIVVEADVEWGALEPEEFDAVVLPGGMPGTLALRDDSRVTDLVRRFAEQGRLTAAVCAAPLVLAASGVLTKETPFTCHPSTRESLAEYGPKEGPRVIRSGQVITSQGPGTALEFALAIVERLVGESKATALADAMLVRR